jgi:hypothetical protein
MDITRFTPRNDNSVPFDSTEFDAGFHAKAVQFDFLCGTSHYVALLLHHGHIKQAFFFGAT